jgi:MYXO-CTERM domain-containing protein
MQVIGFGTAARIAVDPSVMAPVALWEDPPNGFVYKRFLGPDWGREIRVDTGGLGLPLGVDDIRSPGVDFVLDDYGRPRVVFVDELGVYHTRYTNSWSPLQTLLTTNLNPIGLGTLQVRVERDLDERVHVLYWTTVWPGRRSYHVFDDGSGFATAEHFDSGGWHPHGVTDSAGSLHVSGIDDFPDPPRPHMFQTIYWHWPLGGPWPNPVMISNETNPATGNGAGPVGSAPEIALDPSETPYVVYPMHETEQAQNGEMHIIHDTGAGWSQPVNLFPCNGHGGQPRIAIDKRNTKLVIGLVYAKHWDYDTGSGWQGLPHLTWHSSGSNWQFHDLVETNGLFWHVYVPVYWRDAVPGDICVQTFYKNGTCPGVPADDQDDDGVPDAVDLCPQFPDPAQGDADGDGTGDMCDTDDDDDGVPDTDDVCPRVPDDQTDSNNDGLGDACSNLVDNDNDGFLEPYDCEDNDPDMFPGNPEVCDGKDNDCDGQGDPAFCSTGDGGPPTGDGGSGNGAGGVRGGCECSSADPAADSALVPLLLLAILLGGLLLRSRSQTR